ncbi:MAG: GlxA family transcriptional regulator [Solirubrobacteraceae bacterium]
MPTAGATPHHVVALALDGVVLLDLAAPTHLFGHCGAPYYSLELAAVTPGPVRSSTGLEVLARHGLEALARADTVVVAGVGPDTDPNGFAAAAAAVAAAHREGARVMSICTGAFVLAEAGVLDGRRATTHWDSTERLAARYPRVTVDPSALYVDEGSVLTSAGVAAGLDLCLHVIRRDHGAALAAQIARRTVVAPHRDGGQAQFVARPIADAAGAGGSLEPTRAWALDRLEQRLDVVTLARQACMSPRSFARRFRQETGTTPAQWVLDQRTRAAQGLLETTNLPVEHVASRTGFGSATSLRTHFGRRLATTPTAYRRAFRQR